MKNRIIDSFGCMSFNKAKMKERLPYPVYLKWKEVVRTNASLDKETADSIAHAMKEWALEMGATHYSHWFSPLNGLTAKKQEAFIDRNADFETMNRFSGKELIKGEPDASSFPHGGMRSTFEARGYTYWDCTANSFIIDNILYIPTVFVSYTGEKLDKRGPLIASVNALSREGSKITNLFNKNEYTYRLRPKVGLEQEFFLIDKKLYDLRSDLKSCGRTLFGARPPKGQDLEDHYFGAIPKRVQDFYEEVNEKLWQLGIYAKTEHNEVAPCQFEVAIMYENANISIDDNLLCMEILKSTAIKHGLVCLLHEKPFKNVNGSGKHNNYSIVTNYGLNVFEPSDAPMNNYIFLLFTAALIKSVHKCQTLLRICSSSTSNDYRLGGDEAPPAIISIFLGRELENLFKAIESGNFNHSSYKDTIKVENLGILEIDKSDRNRTASVAYTGNKFEFRMLGSSRSAADLNIIINTAMASALKEMNTRLSHLSGDELVNEVYKIVAEIISCHGGVIYDGDNYSETWKKEALNRGLKNFKTYYDALCGVVEEDSYKILLEEEILTEKELSAIYDIFLEDVIKYHSLEIRAIKTMVVKDIVPSAMKELKTIRDVVEFLPNIELTRIANEIDGLVEELIIEKENLRRIYDESSSIDDIKQKAGFLQENATESMEKIRYFADEIEKRVSRENYLIPTYEDMFNSLI